MKCKRKGVKKRLALVPLFIFACIATITSWTVKCKREGVKKRLALVPLFIFAQKNIKSVVAL